MAASINAVAATCVSAPRTTQGQKGGGDDGEDGPQPRRIEHPATFARPSTLWDRTSVAALGPLGDRTLLIIHDHEQVEVADDRFGSGSLLHAFAPCRVVALPCGFPRRPDVSAAAIAVFAQKVVLAHQIGIGAPMRDRVPGIFHYRGTIHAGRRLEQYEFQDHSNDLRGAKYEDVFRAERARPRPCSSHPCRSKAASDRR